MSFRGDFTQNPWNAYSSTSPDALSKVQGSSSNDHGANYYTSSAHATGEQRDWRGYSDVTDYMATTSHGSSGPLYSSAAQYQAGSNWSSPSQAASFSQPLATTYENPYRASADARLGHVNSAGYAYGSYQYDGSSDFATAESTGTAASASQLTVDTQAGAKRHRKSKSKYPPTPTSQSSPSVLNAIGLATAGTDAPKTTKLRSASRASKNTHHNPPATDAERKNRASHNQVEKQYRNRLNAHFERLLEALPEHMRKQGGPDNDDDDENEHQPGGSSMAMDSVADELRRVSKAEVLEMARRYIATLEHDCAALEGERNQLKASMERLRLLFGHAEEENNAAGAHQQQQQQQQQRRYHGSSA